jgi:hypothetical protein
MTQNIPSPDQVLEAFRRAQSRRAPWEGLWRDCFDHCLPGRPGQGAVPIYDGTAPDAAEQLAASLLAELTPPWGQWFGFVPARPAPDSPEAAGHAASLEESARLLAAEMDRANFAVEMHQAFLDLVVAGTALLQVEEAPAGDSSSLRFTAVPMLEAALEEGPSGRLDTVFRRQMLRAADIVTRFPDARLPKHMLAASSGEPVRHQVIEMLAPAAHGFDFAAVLDDAAGQPIPLAAGRFAASPYMAFRWLRAPGETYGRSPVMKALPDIRTANKVVELTLKNASIAVAGIWQAEDDGVLNPANIRLTPGAIIPKAVGSAGLTPLAAPGKFDVSQLVLNDLRARIRHALMADRLGAVQGPAMTATEVLERSAEMARLLGAVYGRLQTELLTPLVLRSAAILRRRGLIPPDHVPDGRHVAIAYRSPLAQVQARGDAANTLLFLEAVAKMGPEAAGTVDAAAAARRLARVLGIAPELIRPETPPATLIV